MRTTLYERLGGLSCRARSANELDAASQGRENPMVTFHVADLLSNSTSSSPKFEICSPPNRSWICHFAISTASFTSIKWSFHQQEKAAWQCLPHVAPMWNCRDTASLCAAARTYSVSATPLGISHAFLGKPRKSRTGLSSHIPHFVGKVATCGRRREGLSLGSV